MTKTSKIFRVFFSSTFSDLIEERNALQKKVFPKLKELCAAYNTRFQPIDLRWGIPAEVGLQQLTMQTCLEEINRCQNITPRPNFLILLGERYGWTPPPSKIPKTEYEVISTHLSENEKTLVEEWYKHDENELVKLDNGIITSVYELQPRGEKYSNYDDWKPIEKEIRETLLEVARKSKLPKNEMVKYFASATHQEIVLGALEAPDAETHVHCFFRKTKGLPEGVKSDAFIEPESENRKYLSNLKSELVQRLPSNIHQYKVDLGNLEQKNEYLERFCKDVYEFLSKTILKELEEMSEVSALDEEINVHIEFGKSRTKVFVGRESILKEIVNYVESDDRAPFVVFGEPGSGKSALMAKAYELLKEKEINAEFILRFFSTSVSSSSSIGILRTICEQITNKYGGIEEEIPFEYNKLVKSFNEKLKLVEGGSKAVLILDALDQLSKNDLGRSLGWLPKVLPENVKIIVSVATDAEDIMEILKKKLPKSLYKLEPLSQNEGNEALNTLLKNALRKLQAEQQKGLLEKFSQSGSPLYLKLAFEEARTWNSYDYVSHTTLPLDIEGLIQILFKRLYKNHTKKTVEKVLSYIVAARNGLTEDEILDVLTSDTDYFNWYKEEQSKYHKLPEPRLPWIVWSRLRSDLEPYLTTRGVDHTSTLVFFHRQFNDVIEKISLFKVAEDCHRVLANYFDSVDFYYQRNGRKTPNYRKLSELVYNLMKVRDLRSRLEEILTDFTFIEAKCLAEMITDLITDYDNSLSLDDALWSNLTRIEEFAYLIRNQSHVLKNYPRLSVQLAINQPNSSAVYKAGIKILKSGTYSRPWFDWLNKPQSQDPCLMTFEGHSDWVNDCAFSPDCTKILSASNDGLLKLWDVGTGEDKKTFVGHSFEVTACAFSPDGKNILSGGNDHTMKLWDVETGAEILTFKDHLFGINACTFSPDGKKVLSASDDKSLKLWDAETGSEILTFKGHSHWVHDCAFSPDGKKVLSASNDKTLKLWDVETGAIILTFIGHSSGVKGCAFSPDGKIVLSSCGKLYEGELRLWNTESGVEIKRIQGHSDIVNSCAFSPDGKKIISASFDNTLKLWEVKTGKELNQFLGHSHVVNACAFSPDGKKILSASSDNNLKLWEVIPGAEIKISKGIFSSVMALAFSPDGKKILSASNDKTLKLWNVKTGEELKTFKGHSIGLWDCAFSPDGMRVLSASRDETLKLWNVETGEDLMTFRGHSDGLKGCAFSPDGKKVLSASDDMTLKLWDVKTGNEIRTFKGHSGIVKTCIFSPDGKKIISGSSQKFISASGMPFTGPPDMTLKLWDVKTGKELKTFKGHIDGVRACVFSPDGKKILSASYDKTLKLWDVETGAIIQTFIGHSNWVNDCAFTPNGKKILSVSSDFTLRVWDIETCAELAIFPILGPAFSIAVNNREILIVAGDQFGTIYIIRPNGIEF